MFRRSKAAQRSQELVFLDPDDDLGTIRSKLESTTAEEVYLVVPRRSPVLRTPLEFRILARVANELSSETIIVSDNPTRRRLAEHEGFRTRRSLRTLKHLMLRPDQRPPLFVVPDWVPGLLPVLSFLLPVGAAATLAAVAIPQMRVTLVPQTTPVGRDLEITVDPAAQALDPARAILPGEVITQEVTERGALPIPAERTVGKDKARGEIIILNSRPQPHVLQKGTRVMVEGGPKFVLDQEVSAPPGVPVRAGITAVDAGSAGNVRAGAITAFDGFDASGLAITQQRPTTGGTDRQARVVTEEDIARLRQDLLAQARRDAVGQLRTRAGQDRSLPDETIQVQPRGEKFDQQLGQEADQLTGTLTAQATAVAFENARFNELVAQILVRDAGGGSTLSGDPKISPPAIQSVQGQTIKLRTRAEGVVVQEINAAQLQERLRGTTPEEAEARVARISGLAQQPRVEITPSWAPRAFRVDVVVQGPR